MAIQHRRGNYADFDPTKMVAGEPAVVLGGDPTSSDGKAAYIAFGPGSVKKLATAEDMRDEIYNQTQNIIQEVEEGVADDVERAEAAAESVSSSAAQIAQNTQDISNIKADLSHIGLSDDVKTSLLACFSHVAWVDAHGQDYYDALEAALYADSYPRITAVFDAGINVIYTDDALDTLKQYLTVKYFATKESTGTVISSSDYTLSGTLTEGTSTVTVSYEGVRTSVSIPGVIDFYNISSWSYPDGGILIANATAQMFDKIIAQNTFRVPCLNYNGTNRRAPYVTHGKIPFVDAQGNELDGRYPIPVPDGATGITATVVPSSSYLNIRPYQYDDVNGYNSISETGWKQGTATRAGLDSSLKYFFHINIKYDAAGQSYPTEPTSISITFSFD